MIPRIGPSFSRCASYLGNASASCGENLAISARVFVFIPPEEEMAAVREWREEGRVFRVDAVAAVLQLQILDDSILQQAG